MKQMLSFFFVINLGLSYTVNGQWQALKERATITRILYSVQDDVIKPSNKYLFPEYRKEDTIIDKSYKIKFDKAKKETSVLEKGDYYFQIKLKKNISLYYDSTIIYARYYLENIKGYKFYFHSTLDSSWFQAKYHVTFSKYQLPLYYMLSKEDLMPVKTDSKINKRDSLIYISVDTILIVPELTNKAKKPIMTFADFKIYNVRNDMVKYSHPFLQTLVGDNDSEFFGNSFTKIPSLPLNLLSFTWYISLQEGKGPIILKKEKGVDPSEALYQLFDRMFSWYPFFKEKGLDKEYYKDRIDIIYHTDSLPLREKIDETRLLIGELHDPHFKIYKNEKSSKSDAAVANTKKKERRKEYPILPGVLGNSVYICAILDSSFYEEGITPGKKITKLNARPVWCVIDSIEKTGIELSSLQQSKYLFNYAFNKTDTTNKITICDSDGTNTLEVQLQKIEQIENLKNFEPIHGEFKEVGPGIGYFRLNSFMLGDYIRFINHFEELKKYSGLIIDIRNNPGGQTIETLRIISTLIKQPYVFAHEEVRFRGGIQTETQTVVPNKHFDLSHLRVIVLINEKTICAGEFFAYFLQHNQIATMIGNNKTPGHIAHAQALVIPEYNINMRFNSLSKFYTDNYRILENIGVKPDISVSLLHPNDLYPYQDKVLETAIHYLKYNN